MSITDELRKWGYGFCGSSYEVVNAIADRIDAEHENACAEAYGNGVMSVPIALDESAWVKLPKDADNVPVSIGDRMEWVRYKDDDPTIVRIVSGIGNGVFFAWSDEQGRYAQYKAHAYRHHHAPTVEDVLREFSEKMNENLGMYTGEAIDADEWRQADSKTIAEYAAKLKLAEGEDE